MARLIDADRLAVFPHEPTSGTEDAITEWIEDIFSTEEIIDHKEDLEKLCWKAINGFIGVIETEPTVDAAPVVHGEWEISRVDPTTNYIQRWRCTVCNKDSKDEYDYCPNCGADMRVGRWKGEGMGDYSCSLCGEVVNGNHREECPNCHAKMDGGDKA